MSDYLKRLQKRRRVSGIDFIPREQLAHNELRYIGRPLQDFITASFYDAIDSPEQLEKIAIETFDTIHPAEDVSSQTKTAYISMISLGSALEIPSFLVRDRGGSFPTTTFGIYTAPYGRNDIQAILSEDDDELESTHELRILDNPNNSSYTAPLGEGNDIWIEYIRGLRTLPCYVMNSPLALLRRSLEFQHEQEN